MRVCARGALVCGLLKPSLALQLFLDNGFDDLEVLAHLTEEGARPRVSWRAAASASLRSSAFGRRRCDGARQLLTSERADTRPHSRADLDALPTKLPPGHKKKILVRVVLSALAVGARVRRAAGERRACLSEFDRFSRTRSSRRAISAARRCAAATSTASTCRRPSRSSRARRHAPRLDAVRDRIC